MTTYTAPIEDMRFVLEELVGIDALTALYPDAGLDRELLEAVLDQAGRFAASTFAPLDPVGDAEGLHFANGVVATPAGFRAAYRQFVEDGWNTLSCSPQFGGQGFPRTVSSMVEEMWRASNMALTGCITLTRSAIEAIDHRASAELKQTYLPAMVRGDWTGTMNLTEPQAGSDLSAIQTKAELHADGTYRLFGQKIFISWGRHDLSDNIIHLVLARQVGGPEGIKGLSMFLVPEKLLDADGKPAIPNDVVCGSIENKVGQHAAPSTTMIYGGGNVGGEAGAVGYLVGEIGCGLEIMFIVMNEARFGVGVEGLAATERAYQTALAYARERIQGVEAGGDPKTKVAIIRHPDVRRMLMCMKSAAEAMRATAGFLAFALDRVQHSPDSADRAQAVALLDLLTPVFKAWNTETANEMASLGVQIHGGLGFMEKCPGAQHWKDARITAIYEGTTAIQANDLVGRKIARDGGCAALALVEAIRATAEGSGEDGANLARAAAAIERCVAYINIHYQAKPQLVLAVAVPILEIFGISVAGWQLARSAQIAERMLSEETGNPAFLRSKIATARFFAAHWMPRIDGLIRTVEESAGMVLALAEDQF